MAMAKFNGAVGSFGDVGMFYEGLESQIGMPDPLILKGLLRENVLGPDSNKKRISSNYMIVNSDKHEYARLLGHPAEYSKDENTVLCVTESDHGIPIFFMEVAKGMHKGVGGPTENELMDLRPEFKELQECYNRICAQTNGLFPGEIGYTQRSLEIQFQTASQEQMQKFLASFDKRITDLNMDGTAFVQLRVGPSEADFSFPMVRRLTIFWPIVSENSRKFEAWIKKRKLFEILSSVTYIYCDEANAGTARKLGKLRELLMRLSDSQLSQICDGFAQAQSSKEGNVDLIMKEVSQPGPRPITLIQGRKRISLRELMAVREVKDAELRVEEAIQAYQYTGPLYLVSLRP
jgi:hypothetical protein